MAAPDTSVVKTPDHLFYMQFTCFRGALPHNSAMRTSWAIPLIMLATSEFGFGLSFAKIPIGSRERAVAFRLAPLGVILETELSAGVIQTRWIDREGRRIRILPEGWVALPGESESTMLFKNGSRLVCYYDLYSSKGPQSVALELSPDEAQSWAHIQSVSRYKGSNSREAGCEFTFDDSTLTRHLWVMSVESVREVRSWSVKGQSETELGGEYPSIGGASCLEGCYLIRGVNITNTSNGSSPNATDSSDTQTLPVYPEAKCDGTSGLQISGWDGKSKLVSPKIECESAELADVGCELGLVWLSVNSRRLALLVDPETGVTSAQLAVDEGEAKAANYLTCGGGIQYLISGGVPYRVVNRLFPDESTAEPLHPESIPIASRKPLPVLNPGKQ